jgi:hypothetical protein
LRNVDQTGVGGHDLAAPDGARDARPFNADAPRITGSAHKQA